MRKQMYMVIILICVITIGLCGCISEDNSMSGFLQDDTLVSFEDLDLHLARYIGEEITIEGYVAGAMDLGGLSAGTFSDSPSNAKYAISIIYDSSNVTIYRGLYRLTGVVEELQYYPMYICQLDVKSAEPQ